MRVLLLTALLATAAAAQDAPLVVPPVGSDRCDAPATMPTPFEADPAATIAEVELDGPEPVPMPNLCGEMTAFAGPAETLRPPTVLYDGDGPLPGVPEAFRRLMPPRVIPLDEFMERYRDRLPEGSDLFDLLQDLPEGGLVAPLPEHE